jgi:chromosomal replication initiation ATPase DnaA
LTLIIRGMIINPLFFLKREKRKEETIGFLSANGLALKPALLRYNKSQVMEQSSLFDSESSKPLPERLRPRDLDEFVGQEQLLGEGKVLRHLIESDQISSMIFWGPPGVGKTTLAEIIANRTKAKVHSFFGGHKRHQ